MKPEWRKSRTHEIWHLISSPGGPLFDTVCNMTFKSCDYHFHEGTTLPPRDTGSICECCLWEWGRLSGNDAIQALQDRNK